MSDNHQQMTVQQYLSPLVTAGGIYVTEQNEFVISYKTKFNKPLLLYIEPFSEHKLQTTLINNPNFRELIRKDPKSREAFKSIFNLDENNAEVKSAAQGDKVQYYKAIEEKVRTHRLANDGLEQELKLRKEYADKIYKLVLGWIAFLGVLTLADASYSYALALGNSLPKGVPYTDIWISDALLMFLWGTATTTVIGLFVYVAKHLFPAKNETK